MPYKHEDPDSIPRIHIKAMGVWYVFTTSVLVRWRHGSRCFSALDLSEIRKAYERLLSQEVVMGVGREIAQWVKQCCLIMRP